jgi:hypothetical protein
MNRSLLSAFVISPVALWMAIINTAAHLAQLETASAARGASRRVRGARVKVA